MDKKKVIIIGAGISGLSAGCYLQMNGYETEIFEQHNLPGGLCTSWKKKGYTFDGCIHWLVGTKETNSLNKLWKELDVLSEVEIVDHEEFYAVYNNGFDFTFYNDSKKLEQEMLKIAPEDKKQIRKFIKTIKRLKKASLPERKPRELYSLKDIFKMLIKWRSLILFKKYMSMTIEEYLERFENEKLKEYLSIFFPSDNFSALAVLMTYAWLQNEEAGYPIGGSLAFAKRLANKYQQLGGKTNYNSKVNKIIVEQKKASGIQLTNNEIHNGDIIIYAADGYYTHYHLLEGKYLTPEIDEIYDQREIFESLVIVSMGINYQFKGEPHSISYIPQKDIQIDPETKLETSEILLYNFDPTLAPEGKTSVAIYFPTGNFNYWKNLREYTPKEYQNEKKRLASIAKSILEDVYPKIQSKIEVVDVSTPATFHRYTNNWKGSFEGWIPTPGFNSISKTLPGIKNFYHIGQWVEPGGGLPPAVYSGRMVTQSICLKDGKEFQIK
jgi:phytoene dehydrogenase-like protein